MVVKHSLTFSFLFLFFFRNSGHLGANSRLKLLFCIKDPKSIPLQLRDWPTVAAVAAVQWAGEKYHCTKGWVESQGSDTFFFNALDVFKEDLLFSLGVHLQPKGQECAAGICTTNWFVNRFFKKWLLFCRFFPPPHSLTDTKGGVRWDSSGESSFIFTNKFVWLHKIICS